MVKIDDGGSNSAVGTLATDLAGKTTTTTNAKPLPSPAKKTATAPAKKAASASRSRPPAKTGQAIKGGGNTHDFAVDVLTGLGMPVTTSNIQAIMAWSTAESKPGRGAAFNPMNTTQPAKGATNFNTVGVKNFTSYQQGVQATVQTLRNGHYGPILNAFKKGNDAFAVASAVAASPWGTGQGVTNVLNGGKVVNQPIAGASTGGYGPATGGAGSGLTPTATPDTAVSIQNYGFIAALAHSNPELKKLMQKYAGQDLSSSGVQTRLQGEIQNTKWWKTTTAQQRATQELQAQDPAEFRRQFENAFGGVKDLANSLGVSLPGLGLHDFAVNAYKNGWTADEQKRFLLAEGTRTTSQAAAALGPYAVLAGTVPEIKSLVDKATQAQWSPAQFTAALADTTWWKTSTDAQRTNALNTVADPAETAHGQQVLHDKIVTAARNLGIPEGDAVNSIAQQAFVNGWDDPTIQRHLADLVHLGPGGQGATGQTAATVADLKAQASAYLIKLSDPTLQQWVTNIERGDTDVKAFDAYLKEQAKIQRPWAAKQIDAGLTTSQITDPYKQLIASTLEIAPDQVDLTNPRYSAVLDGNQVDGQHGPMSLTQAGQYLRGLDEYKKTAVATDQAAQFASTLTKTFGAVA
jgi:hypothetical protein